MVTPKGVEIGRVWTRKRGYREHAPQLVISNIYRPDRQCLVYVPVNDAHVVVSWVDLRKRYRPL